MLPMTTPHSPDHPIAPAIGACSGSTLGLLFRQARDAMWARMEAELARAAYLHPGAMTRLLDKLEARGILERVADPNDRRALHIHLTNAGKAIWRDIDQCGQRVREAALQGLDTGEREQLLALLERVRDNLNSPTD